MQRLRCSVFPDPDLVMQNLEYLLSILHESHNGSYFFPKLVPTKNGSTWFCDKNGDAWRVLSYIPGSRTLNTLNSPQQAQAMGSALAWFHTTMQQLATKSIRSPLPDLHNTAKYLRAYDDALVALAQVMITNDAVNDCRAFIAARRENAALLQDQAERGMLTHCLIHGDPKAANFLFDDSGRKIISLIDLDTAGRGLLLHDLGDGLRSACNPYGEEMKNSDTISINTDFYNAWLNGYTKQASELLTEYDLAMIPLATWTITFELGVRFFTDHLTGNRYFTTNSPNQNLHRATVQFALCRDMEKKIDALQN